MQLSHIKFFIIHQSQSATSAVKNKSYDICCGSIPFSLSLLSIIANMMLFNLGYNYRFYVDNVPIRVFKNNKNIGVDYPLQPMHIEASLWDGDSWATDGGHTKINWTHAPFNAHFQGFGIAGCPVQNSDIQQCYSSKYWWNLEKYWKLDHRQQREYENVRKKYMNYDYCSDRPRYPTPPPECFN